jgi:hypothetical protein
MITLRTYKYSKLFVFEAHLVHIPDSFNRLGIDPLPRYFIRPTVLKEVLDYSLNPTSVKGGYSKDKKSGLYVKNIDQIDTDQTTAQFEFIKNSPPYGYTSEGSYQAFIENAFSVEYSLILEALFSSTTPKYTIQAGVDPQINLLHYYIKFTDSCTKTFHAKKLKKIAQPSGLIVYDSLEEALKHLAT